MTIPPDVLIVSDAARHACAIMGRRGIERVRVDLGLNRVSVLGALERPIAEFSFELQREVRIVQLRLEGEASISSIHFHLHRY